MEARIQFRVDEETKRLAQLMAKSQGKTLSDACRELTLQMAQAQRLKDHHEQWLAEQVNRAFDKLELEQAEFVNAPDAEAEMAQFKAAIKAKG